MATSDTNRPPAAPIVAFAGSARVVRWALGSVELLGIGLLVPLAILFVGILARVSAPLIARLRP